MLQKAHLTIPLGLGLETSVDDKLLPVGKVVALENAAWSRDGEIIKRPGSTLLGSQYAAVTPGTMPAAWQLATHKGALVTLSNAGPRPIGVYSPKLNRWIAPAGSSAVDALNGTVSKLRGQILPRRGTVYRSNAVGGSTNVVQGWDIASNGIYALVGWVETNFTASTSTIKAQIVEISTGKTLFWWSQSGTFANTAVRCIFTNGELRLVYVSGVNVKYLPWIITNLDAGTGTPGADVTLATDATRTEFDLTEFGGSMMVIYNGATTRIIRRATGGVNTLSNLTDSGSGAIATGAHCWVTDLSAAGFLSAMTTSVSQGVRVQWAIVAGTGATTTTYTIDGAAGIADQGLSAHTISNAATGEVVCLWSSSGTTQIKYGRRVIAGIDTGNWIFSARLASKTFLHNGDFYNQISYVSPISQEQNTLFAIRVPSNFGDAVDGNRTPSARYCTGSAFSITYPEVPQIVTLSAHVFMTAAGVRVREVDISTAGVQFNGGVDTITLTFNPSTVNAPREFADNLYVCGGVLGAFDGRTFAEEGFHLNPEQPTAVVQVGGSLEPSAIYECVAVYRYTDEFGRQRRSAPSVPVEFQTTAANKQAQITVTTLKLHGRPGGIGLPTANGVVIELYQTTRNEKDSFHLVDVKANDDSVDTITFTVTSPDATTAIGEELYTDDGTLECQSPPPALAVATYKDRLAVISAEDPTLIWISLPLSETDGPRFNDQSTIRIDDSHGDLTGLGVVDDRLVAFKRDAVYAILGDGPDVLGNGTFGIAQIIASGIGCSTGRSIAQDADGVSFRSVSNRDGYYRISRALSVDEFGNDVQKYMQTTDTGFTEVIADAVHIPEQQRTKVFTQLEGRTLVYDHSTKHWSTDIGQTARAATTWNGVAVFQGASSSLSIIVEDATNNVFDDSSSPVEEYVESPWVSFADLKGYERFYRVQVAGQKRFNDTGEDGYKVTLYLFVNFDGDNVFQTQTRNMLVTDDINGLELRYSSKFSAIKLGVRIGQKLGAGTNFRGPKLTALVIEYGVKQGLRKLPSGNRTA